jgi:hypothetical protein
MESKKKLYPITEDYLNYYSIDSPPLIPLYRNYSIQKKYDDYRSGDKFLIFIDNIKNVLQTKKSILQLNDFPYYTTENIKHYVLWINNKTTNNSNKEHENDKINKLFIKNEIKKYFDLDTNINTQNEHIITYWVNSLSNTSIKDILHAHIFTKLIK